MLCRMLKVSRSGYYAWRRRGPSRRALEDARLGLVVASHRDGRGTYGSPRILDDLREAGERVSRKRVARLMTERNLVGEMKKRWRHPSSAPSDAVVAPNTLDRAFNVPEPNRVWASDITYVRTHEGWLYLAVVIDLFSRRVVGWSIQPSMDTDIVLSALTMAVRPAPARTGAAAALRPRLPVHERRLSTGATRSWHRVQLQRPG
jgi:putative transposase